MKRNVEADVSNGAQMSDSPYLWKENEINPYTDAMPSEKFVPTPIGDVGESSKVKRIIKYIAIGLIVAFVLYVVITIFYKQCNNRIKLLRKIFTVYL